MIVYQLFWGNLGAKKKEILEVPLFVTKTIEDYICSRASNNVIPIQS